MLSDAEFGGSILEIVPPEFWEYQTDVIESHLAREARATGNVHSVTGYYTIERIYGDV